MVVRPDVYHTHHTRTEFLQGDLTHTHTQTHTRTRARAFLQQVTRTHAFLRQVTHTLPCLRVFFTWKMKALTASVPARKSQARV